MRKKFGKFRYLLLVSALMAVVVGTFIGGYAYALNIYTKSLDAIGVLVITDEAQVDEMEIESEGKIKIRLKPTANTQADVTYTVHLLLDGIDVAQQTTSWTAAEIVANTKKTVTFEGVALGAATSVKVEVTH